MWQKDVYKRQADPAHHSVYGRAESVFYDGNIRAAGVLVAIENIQRGYLLRRHYGCAHHPVSYTHLDVYKRQMQLGYLTRTPRGRCVTRYAYEHLGMKAPGTAEASGQQTLDDL